jgi:hypothetical protein
MTAAFSTIACLSMFTAASLALAQSTIAAAGDAPGAVSQAADVRPEGEPSGAHADADARACLEFVTNSGVIRCAEKYRAAHAAGTAHPGKGPPVKGSAG